MMKIVLLGGVLLTGAALAVAAAKPENLALKAKVVATSEFNGQYAATGVNDGIIPEAGRNNSAGKEWAVKGNNHPEGVTLTLTWPSPVSIAEVVYYGRTCYAVEAFKACTVSVDDAKDSVLMADLKAGHGPQRMRLKQPVMSATLRLKFTGHHECLNPGAAEIEVYSVPPDEKALGTFLSLIHI